MWPTGLVKSILATLPTSEVLAIVHSVRPRLYINFFDRLPPEVCLKVLGYLDPLSLLNTALASRDWMSLSMDGKLWRHLYFMEGWRVQQSELDHFEQKTELRQIQAARSRPSIDSGAEHADKRRATPNRNVISSASNEDSEMLDVDNAQITQHSSLFGQQSPQRSSWTNMDTAESSSPNEGGMSRFSDTARSPPISRQINQSLFGDRQISSIFPRTTPATTELDLSFLSSLTVNDRYTGESKLNWQYLYTQRRRLEANWDEARYTNFQLPHPDHLYERHEQCIYTIQHSGKYLVSGSRDHTLRIWDLDTRRLVREPLRGHIGSVLCLQFDADPKEDIIVSGSSDATVNIWRFSTGQLIQSLTKAHRESVLNVRFDSRILVTCSKDKTIKIFNRHPMRPDEMGYPSGSRPIAPVPTVLNNYGFNIAPTMGLPVKPVYSLIGILEGHGAAVNAIQIHEDEIVSASGDRHVKVWHWPTQTCTRTLVGHQKGIACVQYDGRRIVSGSSDNEVKVFDKETGLEVASLRAHSDLVRTVQAGFGDLPYSAEEDQADARAVDDQYFKAVDSGAVPRTLHRGQPRNAGSRRPEDIMAYGAKLPPGGGGGHYGRIVSGSYDQTVIIWRRDKDGVWKAQHTLKQAEAAQAALQEFVTITEHSEPVPNPYDPGTQAYFLMIINQVIPQGAQALHQALNQYPQLLHDPLLTARIAAEPTPARRAALRATVTSFITAQQAAPAAALAPTPATAPMVPPPAAAVPTLPGIGPLAPGTQVQIGTNPGNQTVQIAAGQGNPNATFPPPILPAPAGNVTATVNNQGADTARVFKLQFDARRIICCSQTNIIVGWDFADGDKKIIEASRFFAPIE